MKRIVIALCLLFVLGRIGLEVGLALADTPAAPALDAGVDAAPSSPAPAAPAVHDPLKDPVGFLADLKAAKTAGGWGMLVMIALFGLFELGAKVPWLAALDKGRVTIVLGGGAAILMTAIAALAAHTSWMAILFAAGTTAALYYRHPEDIPK